MPGDIAQECLELVIKDRGIESKRLQDGIVTGILRESIAAKASLIRRMNDGLTETFRQIYEIGDGSANSIVEIALLPSAWQSEADRESCEKGVFQLFLAKLLEDEHDSDGRALKGVARLLAQDANKLYNLIDEEIFDAMLCSLDYRHPVEVRSQATLAVAKYMELAESKGQVFLSRFIQSHITNGRNEGLVIAFSAAASVFPIVPTMASALFLTEGFVPSLVPLLDKKIKSDKVDQAALNMLSAACIDSACREAIKKHCVSWLKRVLKDGQNECPGLAAVILAKVLDPTNPATDASTNGQDVKSEVNDLVPMFKKLLTDKTDANKQSAVEGLAYASVQPKVKEALINDRAVTTRIIDTLKDSKAGSPIIYGILTLIDHLSSYLPQLSEEQKRLAELKAYANASKNTIKSEPLAQDAAVSRRCTLLVNVGIVSALVHISHHLSATSTAIVCKILLSLTRTPALRGTIAQQGGARLLLLKFTSISSLVGTNKQAAAQALARIIISLDPTLVFPASGSPPLSSTVRPLLSLLTKDESEVTEGPRDLLPAYEALLALTNIASTGMPDVIETIVRLALPTVEDLLLNNNDRIQTAAAELVCNLMTGPAGIEAFADESKSADRRLHIILALADAQEVATRKAASGALATLTDFEGALKGILARERGISILVDLCGDEDEGVVHRGLVCINNIINVQNPVGAHARNMVKAKNGIALLNEACAHAESQVVKDLASAALGTLTA